MTLVITKSVSIEAKYLDNKIRFHIKHKLEDMMIGHCTFEDGYVTKITRILKIEDNYISPVTSRVIFRVKFRAKTLKPIEGKNLTGNVCMVFSHGIFVEIDKKIKILVPVANMNNYEYNEETLIFEKEKKVIKVGDIVTVTVTKIKYEKKEFGCIGKL